MHLYGNLLSGRPERQHISMSAIYYSQSYREAREKFLQAASGLSQTACLLPGLCGPDGLPLYTDTAYLGPRDAARLLIVSSGLHGIEGYAGSAIQIHTLKHILQPPLPDNLAVLHVHALNPYGFAHDLRTNADNIDLNRNFHDWTQGKPHDHKLAGAVQDILFDQSLMRRYVRAGAFLARYGARTAQAALTQGQFSNPQGLFYGGQALTHEARIWRGLLDRYGANRSHIVHLDLHTGLGQRGHGEIIVADGPDSTMFERAKHWWGPVTSLSDGSSVSARVVGDICTSFNRAASATSHTLATLEFGTVSGYKVVEALLADNRARLQGRGSLQDARNKMRNVFYPQDVLWQEKVLNRGQQVISAALRGLQAIKPD